MAGAEGQNSCTPLNNHSTNQHRPKSSHASFKASAMLKAGPVAIFWVKHFQHCRAGALKPRNTPFSAHCLQMTRGPGAPAPNHLSRQWHFKNRTQPIPQVAVAYSVHVGEKIAHLSPAGCKK